MRNFLLFSILDLSASVLLILRTLSINTDHPVVQLLGILCKNVFFDGAA